MQFLFIVFTLCIGFSAVFQGSLNRMASQSWGLAPVIILNNIVIFIAGFLLYFAVKYYPSVFPEFFRSRVSFETFSWYYLIPGILGLILVAGIPFAISRIGALNVFVGIVCAQMIGSILWDHFYEGIPVTWIRVCGALLTIAGVFLLKVKV